MPTLLPVDEKYASKSIRQLLVELWLHLNSRRRTQLGCLLLVMFASGIAEVFSLAAVIPFLSVLTNPERLWEIPFVKIFSENIGIYDAQNLIIPTTLLFGAAAILAAAVRLINLWLNTRLAAAIGSDLSCEAYRRTLYQPYSVHIQSNTSSVINASTTYIAQTVRVITLCLQVATASVVAFSLLIALLIADWQVAITSFSLFALAYSFLAFVARRKLTANSAVMAKASQEQVQYLQEGLGAIKDILLDGSQNIYVNSYRRADLKLRKTNAQNVFLAGFPRFGLEALGLLLIACLALLLSLQAENSLSLITLLGTLALGAQRLLPAMQQIYSGWATIRSFRVAVFHVMHILDKPIPQPESMQSNKLIKFSDCVSFRDVCFKYSEGAQLVLNKFNIEFFRGDRIGIIGTTGSGKSTLFDLLMGLLKPSDGKILVDGIDLHDPQHRNLLVAWRSMIAHVPQSIYLSDCSIAENIAFGVPPRKIDMKRVRIAAQQAQISSFIESSVSSYSTFVGERGVRLSGGQRQRIGIARALYKQASIIVFDEATSALDNQTEDLLMKSMYNLSEDLTLILIAHRLSSLRQCNKIFEVKGGKSIKVNL